MVGGKKPPYVRRQTKKGKPDKSGGRAPVVPKKRPPVVPTKPGK